MQIKTQSTEQINENPKEKSEFHFKSEIVNDNILKYTYFNGEEPLTYRQLIDGLLQNSSDSKQLVSVLTDSLADANGKLSSYYWECAPVSVHNQLCQQFECVAVKAKELGELAQII